MTLRPLRRARIKWHERMYDIYQRKAYLASEANDRIGWRTMQGFADYHSDKAWELTRLP